MLPWLDSGNPSSLHQEGRRAKAVLDEARETISDALGCLFAEALFTSGGTEGANLALIGTALQNADGPRKRILLSSAEHHCVLGTRSTLEALGYKVEWIPVDREARVDFQTLRDLIDDQVLIVSAMHANNELGTLNPVEQIGELAHEFGALYHCDAVQTFGKALPGGTEIFPKLSRLPVDILTISAHKIGGPKAVGAIFIRAGVKLKPLVAGGGQEREVRGGTENVAGIVGFAAAVKTVTSRPFSPQVANPRDPFLSTLISEGFVPTIDPLAGSEVLSTHAHVRLPGVDAETMLIRLDREGVSASSGAACSSGSVEPSHVLLACGYSDAESKEGLRFTFSPSTTVDEANEAARIVASVGREVKARRS
jgi:cysteine desulfurase